MKQVLKDVQKALLSGVSFMMPIVVAGGVILAVSLLGAQQTPTGLVPANDILKFLNTLGKAGMAMMIPVFSAYIAYSMAGKPGLTPGFILGFMANNAVSINGTDVKTGFLGAMILGILSGYVVKWMKSWNVGKSLRSVMPIIIIPVLTVLGLGLIYYFVISRTRCAISGMMSLLIAKVTAPTEPGTENINVLLFTPASAREAIALVPISSV